MSRVHRQTEESDTYQDIVAQGESLARTLEVLEAGHLPVSSLAEKKRFVFTGCGSSYYVGKCAASLLRLLAGVDARAVPASELWLLPCQSLSADTLLVGVSRTGTTTEVVRAMEAARRARATTLAVSIGSEPETFNLADHRIWLGHAVERSPVMTQSFSNLLLAAQHVALQAAEGLDVPATGEYRAGMRNIPAWIADSLGYMEDAARRFVNDGVGGPKSVAFLGSGPHEAICAEAALKVVEMSRIPAVSYPPLEYRHGPIAALDSETTIFAVCTRTSRPFDDVVLADAASLGGRSVSIGVVTTGENTVMEHIEIPEDVPEWLTGNLTLPLFQLFAYYLTVRLGQVPESVRHLDRNKESHIDPHTLPLDLDLRHSGGV